MHDALLYCTPEAAIPYIRVTAFVLALAIGIAVIALFEGRRDP